ncbi:hypothetical protein [Paraburkholderia rhizosphaerae]|uniref:Lipoprotein n=1 Tax=Paraburkholderia rhizosphaerae TaxID=480658 RepID=A0A4R8LLJ0_9BURK|nr:hypothetical protein [Paraburkholderia rhizosphaerae]TDY45408.1 hypothetical protein BX592_11475 [Paraburkholderia rhizosphaerae]
MSPLCSVRRLCRAWVGVVASVLSIAACTVQLAPDYDPALSSGIRNVNSEIMSLYSSTSMGTSADTFAERADRYDQIIGSLDALALQSQSRPIPDDALRGKVEQYLKDRNAYPTRLSDADASDLAAIEARMAARCAAKLKHTAPIQSAGPVMDGGRENPIPSAMALTQASRSLAYMRSMDCAQGLRAEDVLLNKGQVQHFMFEALAYEDFLDRQGQGK